jgi:hypothetical protein
MVGPRCTKGHEVAEDARFCPECGEALDGATPPDPRPTRRRRRPLVLGAVLLIGLAAGAVAAVTLQGGEGDEDREAAYVAAIRKEAPETTYTLSDDQLIETARSICRRELMTRGEAQRLATDFEVSLAEVTAPVRLAVDILCPERRDDLEAARYDAPAEEALTTPQASASTTTAPPTTRSALDPDCPAGEPGFPSDEPGFAVWEDAARCVLAAWQSGDPRLLATYVEPEGLSEFAAVDSPDDSLSVESCFGNTGIGCDLVGSGDAGRFSISYSAAATTTADGVPIANGLDVLDLPSDDPILYGNGLGDAHLGDDFDAAVAALVDVLGPSDAELFVGCAGVRQVAWGGAGVFLQSADGQTVSHVRIFAGSAAAGPELATLGGVRVGDAFPALQARYDGDVVDEGEDLYGNRIVFQTGPDAGVIGLYDPSGDELPITELGIGREECGD